MDFTVHLTQLAPLGFSVLNYAHFSLCTRSAVGIQYIYDSSYAGLWITAFSTPAWDYNWLRVVTQIWTRYKFEWNENRKLASRICHNSDLSWVWDMISALTKLCFDFFYTIVISQYFSDTFFFINPMWLTLSNSKYLNFKKTC